MHNIGKKYSNILDRREEPEPDFEFIWLIRANQGSLDVFQTNNHFLLATVVD